MSAADQYKRRFFLQEVADDQELPPGKDKDHRSGKVVPLYPSNLPVVLTTADRIVSPFPFVSPDETSRIAFDLLDQDLRNLKGRYLAALEKKADAADRPELAQDIRIIAKRVEASFTSLILLSDLLAGLPHDNDDVPA